MRALAVDPDNSVALKNLGAIFGGEGDSLKALYYLRKSFEIDPDDPQTVNGLALAYRELNDLDNAELYFRRSWRWRLRRACIALPGTDCER